MEKYDLDAAAISNYSHLSDALARLAELEAGLPVINTAGALLDAITDAQSGSTIYITGDIELDAMSSASLKYRDSSKTLTIEGNGHEINFNNKSGFMYIGIDRITIRDLTFKNAKMSNYDGSVLSLRDSTKALIENCNFINNRSAKRAVRSISTVPVRQNLRTVRLRAMSPVCTAVQSTRQVPVI